MIFEADGTCIGSALPPRQERPDAADLIQQV